MLNIEKVLKNYNNIIFIVKDELGNIVYTNDDSFLELYNNANLEELTSIFHDRENNIWYEIDVIDLEEQEKKYKVEVFKDITKLKQRIMELETDETTRLIIKKVTFEEVNKYLKYAISNNEESAMIIGDVDFFKKINDTYGHLFGDEVLRKISETLFQGVRHSIGRPIDIVGRIGGEEILILIKNISSENALKCAERCRERISNITFVHEGSKPFSVTMSFGLYHVGVKEFQNVEEVDEFRSLILRRCDKALYNSKNNGRNKVSQYIKSKTNKIIE